MGITTIIKSAIGQYTVRKKAKNLIRQKRYYNFESAKSIGIIFDATNTDNYSGARFLSKYLNERKIKCNSLGFLKPHDISDESSLSLLSGFSFFSEKDFNIFGNIKNPLVQQFCKNQFNILIDLHTKSNYFIEAIVALSDASMKVGLKSVDKGYYDFIFEMNEPFLVEELIEQIKIYLNQIKTS
jgi:hypothetical protein